MKYTKRVVSLLLAMTMVLSLAACGSADTSKSTAPSAPASSPAASAPSTSAEPAKPAEPATPTEPAEPAERTKITFGIKQRANVAEYDNNDLTLYMEEQSGYDIEFVFFDSKDWATQLATMVAANEELPDILYDMKLDPGVREVYGMDGYFIDLLPYFKGEQGAAYRERCTYLYGEGFFEDLMRSTASNDGGVYGVAYVNGTGDSPLHVYINQSWLDNLGLNAPATYDELVDVLRAFKTKDPNGNGKADEIPMLGAPKAGTQADIAQWLVNNWIYVHDTYSFNVEDGKLYLPYTTDEYREAMKALNDLVDEGLLSDLTWSIKENSEVQSIWTPASGEALVGVMASQSSLGMAQDNPIMFEYQPLQPLGYAPMASKKFSDTYTYITEDADDPAACFDLLMLMCTADFYIRGYLGILDRDWVYVKDANGNILGRQSMDGISVRGEGTTSTWGHVPHCTLMNNSVERQYLAALPPDKNDWTWNNYRSDLSSRYQEEYTAIAAERNPAAVLDWNISYTEEELDELGTVNTDLKTYFSTSRAEFAVGVLDPYSDTDWNNYVKTVESLGAETWTKVTQSAYDRFMSN